MLHLRVWLGATSRNKIYLVALSVAYAIEVAQSAVGHFISFCVILCYVAAYKASNVFSDGYVFIYLCITGILKLTRSATQQQ